MEEDVKEVHKIIDEIAKSNKQEIITYIKVILLDIKEEVCENGKH